MHEPVSRTRVIVGSLVFFAAFAAGADLVWKRSFTQHWARPELAPARPAIAPHAAFPVHVRSGPESPAVRSGRSTHAGTPSDVSCSTCHSTRAAQVATVSTAQLNEFHEGLQYTHGAVSCLSCHNAANYDTLKKADGVAVPFVDTMQLCAQCHGPQHRDYQHASHGGMNGFWDLGRGPRQRNTCTDCHDPHSPAFQRVTPVFPPQDRGARQQKERDAHGDLSHE